MMWFMYIGNEIGHPLRHRTVAKTVARTNREEKSPCAGHCLYGRLATVCSIRSLVVLSDP